MIELHNFTILHERSSESDGRGGELIVTGALAKQTQSLDNNKPHPLPVRAPSSISKYWHWRHWLRTDSSLYWTLWPSEPVLALYYSSYFIRDWINENPVKDFALTKIAICPFILQLQNAWNHSKRWKENKIQTGEQEKVVRQESGGKKSDIHFNFYIVYFGEKKNASPMISFDTVFMNPDRKK